MSSPPDESYRVCEMLARRSRSNFYCAFLSLPREMFREMCALYAFMRHTDDLGDAPGLEFEQRRQGLAAWRAELVSALAGEEVDSEILPALTDVVRRREIPAAYLFDVIAGVESDLSPREFRTFPELEHYCYQVAGAVGLCCLHIWGFQGEEARVRQWGIDCGTAFQLTNILRDLGEDARAGRTYLPTEDLSRFSVTADQLRDGELTTEFRSLMEFETQRAWSYYVRALPLLDDVSPQGRRILSSFMEIYSSLLTEMKRRRFDVFSSRVRLSRLKKATVALRCFLGLGGRTAAISVRR